MLHVSELNIYPLKSAKGISVNSLNYFQRGPQFDRHWMVINSKNRFLTQRQLPMMCLIKTQLTANQLMLSAPHKKPLSLNIDNDDINKKVVTVWHDQVEATDCGSEAANWLSDLLDTECRLVSMPTQTKRLIDPEYASNHETVSFADGFPSLIISHGSLEDFNSKLDEPISMAHFRPNIVIDGCPPYAEDEWKKIKINNINFSLVKPCSRCIIPAIEPHSGKKRMDVIQGLNKFRRRGNSTYFGQNALHDTQGKISVGDQVEIIA